MLHRQVWDYHRASLFFLSTATHHCYEKLSEPLTVVEGSPVSGCTKR